MQQSNNTCFMYCRQQIPQYNLPLFLRTHSFNGVIKISLRYIPLQTRKNKGEERKYVRGGEWYLRVVWVGGGCMDWVQGWGRVEYPHCLSVPTAASIRFQLHRQRTITLINFRNLLIFTIPVTIWFSISTYTLFRRILFYFMSCLFNKSVCALQRCATYLYKLYLKYNLLDLQINFIITEINTQN